jgi:hypothetical protein
MHQLTGLTGITVVNRNLSFQSAESADSGHGHHIANIWHMVEIPLQATSFPSTNFQGGQQ